MKRNRQTLLICRNPVWVLLLAGLLLCWAPGLRANSIITSKHNLSASGPGSVKALTEREVCIFCHAPHRASEESPLWNHNMSKASYIVYDSPTMKANVEQPNGSSKLCLSCHDGTVAVGMVNSQASLIEMQDGVTTMPLGASNIGTNLSQHHPISFTFSPDVASNDGNLVNPDTLTDKVRLDHNKQMQCTACHDPHDDQYGNFLVMQNNSSQLCLTCHINPLWTSSAHHISPAPLAPAAAAFATQVVAANNLTKGSAAKTASKGLPKTVAANACNSCHATHGAAGRKQLLLHSREEETCFPCHNGSVARQNIEAEFNKFSAHPVLQTSKLHQAGENLLNAPRHVACADCHNPHEAKITNPQIAKNPTAAGSALSGALVGVKGMNRAGSVVKTASHEYEVCFRCHGDNFAHNLTTVSRVISDTSMREKFNPSNQSYHPVVATGKNPNVPSLMAPYNAGVSIKCTDCHNSDQGPGAGGSGPSGPHGSAFAPLLERQLITADHTVESPASYALCYKCHIRESILSDQSFRAANPVGQDRGHRFHIVTEQTSCTTCHDSHGVSTNKNLINFNPAYVTASSNGRIEYKSTGFQSGNCSLTCHGYDHVAAAYPNAMNMAPAKLSRPR